MFSFPSAKDKNLNNTKQTALSQQPLYKRINTCRERSFGTEVVVPRGNSFLKVKMQLPPKHLKRTGAHFSKNIHECSYRLFTTSPFSWKVAESANLGEREDCKTVRELYSSASSSGKKRSPKEDLEQSWEFRVWFERSAHRLGARIARRDYLLGKVFCANRDFTSFCERLAQ